MKYPYNNELKVATIFVLRPSRHTTLEQRWYDVVVTFWRRFDVHATSFQRHVPAGEYIKNYCLRLFHLTLFLDRVCCCTASALLLSQQIQIQRKLSWDTSLVQGRIKNLKIFWFPSASRIFVYINSYVNKEDVVLIVSNLIYSPHKRIKINFGVYLILIINWIEHNTEYRVYIYVKTMLFDLTLLDLA